MTKNLSDFLGQICEDCSSSGGGIPDAPNDGLMYARQDGEWVPVSNKSTILGTVNTISGDDSLRGIVYDLGNNNALFQGVVSFKLTSSTSGLFYTLQFNTLLGGGYSSNINYGDSQITWMTTAGATGTAEFIKYDITYKIEDFDTFSRFDCTIYAVSSTLTNLNPYDEVVSIEFPVSLIITTPTID